MSAGLPTHSRLWRKLNNQSNRTIQDFMSLAPRYIGSPKKSPEKIFTSFIIECLRLYEDTKPKTEDSFKDVCIFIMTCVNKYLKNTNNHAYKVFRRVICNTTTHHESIKDALIPILIRYRFEIREHGDIIYELHFIPVFESVPVPIPVFTPSEAECFICLESFTEDKTPVSLHPKMSDIHHCMCLECFRKVKHTAISSRTLIQKCPLCRHEYDVNKCLLSKT